MSAVASTSERPGWNPTHRVPSGGLEARSDPDAAAAPSVQLAAGLDLTIVDVQGTSTQVEGSNGWRGWVDGGRLEPLGDDTGASPGPDEGEITLLEAAAQRCSAALDRFETGERSKAVTCA